MTDSSSLLSVIKLHFLLSLLLILHIHLLLVWLLVAELSTCKVWGLLLLDFAWLGPSADRNVLYLDITTVASMLVQKKGASVWSTASSCTLLHTNVVVHYHLGFQGLINDMSLVLRLDIIHIGATLLFLFLLHRVHFSIITGSGWSYIRGTARSQMVLRDTTRFIWTSTIVIILVDLTVIEAIAHVQRILIVVVNHTFSVSFTRLSELVLIVSTMTASIDDLFLMLIAVGSICLGDNNALHEVVVLWNHATLVRSMSITWISHLLLARLIICFTRHCTWTNASTGLIVVVDAFHVLSNNVIFTLVLWSMRSWLTLKTRVWLSGRVILLINIAVKCIVVRRVTTKAINIVQANLRLMQQFRRAGRSVILVTAQI